MLRFQGIQSKFSFKLNIYEVSVYMQCCSEFSRRSFCYEANFLPAVFMLPLFAEKKNFSARFVADAFIDHICRIKDMS